MSSSATATHLRNDSPTYTFSRRRDLIERAGAQYPWSQVRVEVPMSFGVVRGIDLQGLLGLADVPAGYEGILIETDIKAKNASDADLDDLLQFAQAHSPACNSVCRPVPVVIERVKR